MSENGIHKTKMEFILLLLRRLWKEMFSGERIYITRLFYFHTKNIERKKTVRLVSSNSSDICWQKDVSINGIELMLDTVIKVIRNNKTLTIVFDGIECHIKKDKKDIFAEIIVDFGYGLGLQYDKIIFDQKSILDARKQLRLIVRQLKEGESNGF